MQINHRAEAEKHLATAAHHNNENPPDMRIAEVSAWIGQGYAALARDEQQAASHADMRDALTLLRRRDHAVREVLASHIAGLLTSTDRGRWSAARSLAQALDAADVNVDNDVDERLTDSGNDPQEAWGGSHLAAEPDPWAANPAVQKIQNFYRITTEQIVHALLDPNGIRGSEWARRLTWALESEGIDLTDGIRARVNDLTLGADPNEPPF